MKVMTKLSSMKKRKLNTFRKGQEDIERLSAKTSELYIHLDREEKTIIILQVELSLYIKIRMRIMIDF